MPLFVLKEASDLKIIPCCGSAEGFVFWINNSCETDYLAPCCCFLHACNVITMVTEKLRQNDETLKEVLEERQTLIAELLHVQPSDLADKVRVSILYTNLEYCIYAT